MSGHQRQRVFAIRLAAKPGNDPTRALRWLLKIAWRTFELKCVSIVEETDDA